MKTNPYQKYVEDCQRVKTRLMAMMVQPELDMKLFRNIAAVYLVWQKELHEAQIEASAWDKANINS